MKEIFQDDSRLAVVHSTNVWLPRTEYWLYVQLRSLPKWVTSQIVCRSELNTDEFPLPNIRSLSGDSRLRLFWDARFTSPNIQRYLGMLAETLKLSGAHILHSHFGVHGWLNLHAAGKRKVKHVVSFYGKDIGKYPTNDPRWRERYKNMFNKVDIVLCEGPHMAGLAVEMGCPEDKARIHRLGADVDQIAFQPRKWNTSEPLRALIASSFREKKGIPYALEALSALHHKVDLEITIIGDAISDRESREEKEKILAVIEKRKLHSKVRMPGFQPHSALLREAYGHHVFISPSMRASDGDIEGGAPISIIEMAATGMPVISTRHCDIPQILEHGVTGLLSDEKSVDSLVENLEWLIANTDKWDEMTRFARNHVEKQFDAKIQGEELAAIYKEIVFSH